MMRLLPRQSGKALGAGFWEAASGIDLRNTETRFCVV